MQMRQRDVAALDAKYTKELAGAEELKMMLCVMMLPLEIKVVGRIKAVCRSVLMTTTASGVDNAASPDWPDTAEQDYFTLREADHYAKTTGRNPEIILMSSADRVAHIDGQLMQLL